MSEIVNWFAGRWAILLQWGEAQPTNGELLIWSLFGLYFLTLIVDTAVKQVVRSLEAIRQAIRQPPYDPF